MFDELMEILTKLFTSGEKIYFALGCAQVGNLGIQGWLQGPGQLQGNVLIGVPSLLEASALLYSPRPFWLVCWGLCWLLPPPGELNGFL